MNSLFILLQWIAPQALLSRLAGLLANSNVSWWKNFIIGSFVRRYKVDMSEAQNSDPTSYKNFNDFFTRKLKTRARIIDDARESIVSPADGAVSQLGRIKQGKIFQAKNHYFTCEELLGGNKEAARQYVNGSFTTIYLSPRDYHRVHMPLAGELKSMTYIPGKLFSVNQITCERLPGLFARNERVVAEFATELGPMALVMVGAMIVASIETSWAGQIAPGGRKIKHWEYDNSDKPIYLEKGEEVGRFKLGSTVILLFPEDTLSWQNELSANSPVQMGQQIANLNLKT